MKFTGDAVLNAPVDRVWDALLDPSVLVRTIPGCERLESTGDNAYAMTVTAGVAAIKGTYAGSCELSDLDQHSSLVMKLQGAGAPGTIGADVNVALPRRRRRHDHGDLRRRRGRRRHGRRRRPADADLGLAPDGGRVLRQRRRASSAAPPPRWPPRPRRPERPPAAVPSAEAGPVSSSRPRSPRASRRSDDFVKGIVRRRRPGAGRRGRRRDLRPPAPLMADLTVDSTARDQAAAVARREISARELLDLHLARIAERNPQLNAIVSLDEERARDGRRARPTRRWPPGPSVGAAARAAVRVQGHPRGGRLAHDLRLAAVRRPRARPPTS